MSEESFVYTECPTGGYCGGCVLKTIVKDGTIERTERTVFTGPEADQGIICQKGIASARYPYQPNRILHPLKRAGERGEGKWEEITWDQALDEIAAKLLDIRDNYGPQAVAAWHWPGGPGMGLNTLLPSRFAHLWGVTDPFHGIGIDCGGPYAFNTDLGVGMGFLMFDPNLIPKAEFIIVWGANPIENVPRIGRYLAQAQDRGIKVVDIGLVFDGTAGKADQFIAIKPGTDAALALSMAQVIVAENKYDRDYLLTKSVAAFLVRDDNGQYVRDAGGNYMVWDDATKKAVSVPPHSDEPLAESSAMTGEFVVGGVACKPAFQLLINHLASYTPEAAESTTGVAPDVVRRLAREYADAKPALVYQMLGIRYQNGGRSYRAIELLAELTGNLGVPGGGVSGCGGPANMLPATLNTVATVYPHGIEGSKARPMRMKEFFETVKTGDPYPIKALLKTGGNPVHNFPSRGRWINEIFPKLDLIVDFELWMTDTSEYADYVLPDCTRFERTDVFCHTGHIVLQEPAIAPLGDARSVNYFMSELAKRVGLGEYFDKTDDEWLEFILASESPSVADITPPLTLERMKAEKLVRANVPSEPVDMFDLFMNQLGLPNPSGRIEFYSEEYADLGEAMAAYVPSFRVGNDAMREEYPFQFFTGRQRFFMQSFFTDDPLLIKLSGGHPSARMNPVDAAKVGVKDGDIVECFNNQDKMTVEMRLDEGVPPGTVHNWYGWRRRQNIDGMYSSLIPDIVGAESVDALAERGWELVLERNQIGPFFLAAESIGGGGWDTMWDALCDVRPASDAKGGQS